MKRITAFGCIAMLFPFLFLNIKIISAEEISIPLKEDTYVESNYQTIAPWNNRNIYLGKDTLYNKGMTRVFFLPDYMKLKELKVNPNRISSATLQMVAYATQGPWQVIPTNLYRVQQIWSMYSLTWLNQPTSLSKILTTDLSPGSGQKSIVMTQTIKDEYSKFLINQPTYGYSLRTNPESDKGLILWSTGCPYASTAPICNIGEEPKISFTYTQNTAPPMCAFIQTPPSLTNQLEIQLDIGPVQDIDGDTPVYKATVCSDNHCSTILNTIIPDVTNKVTIPLSEGEQFIRCDTSDLFEIATGTIHSVKRDTIAPEKPILTAEPPFSAGTQNIISWESSDLTFLSQLQASKYSDFRTPITTDWLNTAQYELTIPSEGKWYFRIKAKDIAGNISVWSNSTTTTQDFTLTEVEYFKTSKEILSPKVDKSGIVSENAYIQGRMKDNSLKKVSLTIYNINQEIVYSSSETDKAYIWRHWPETKTDIKDGIYYVYLFGEDQANQSFFSEPLKIIIDTTAPTLAKVSFPRNNSTLSQNIFKSSFSCESNAKGKVYLNTRVQKEFVGSATIDFDLKDNTYTLKVLCSDLAENSSQIEIGFIVDTTPPKNPKLEIKETGTGFEISFECEKNGKYKVETKTSSSETTCPKENNTSIIITKKDLLLGDNFVVVSLTDSAGNRSDSTQGVLKNAISEVLGIKTSTVFIPCTYVIYLSTKKEIPNCDWSVLKFDHISVPEGFQDQNSFIYKVISSGNIIAKTTVTIIDCKKFDFWDPLTWFGCKQEELLKKEVSLTLIEKINTPENNIRFTNYSNSLSEYILTSTSTLETINLNLSYIGSTLIDYRGLKYAPTIVLERKGQPFNAPKIFIHSSKPFEWIFKRIVEASQWHGDTFYQKPHGGIDFSVTKETILIPADGQVVSVAYNQSSTCFAGGYYMGIKHGNGMYTYFFHLEKKPNFSVGSKVKAGTEFAISGNSGLYNCKALAYHLHFEIRTSAKTTSHVNPVDYVNVDWSLIKTAKANQYPSRLSGDNPHPSY